MRLNPFRRTVTEATGTTAPATAPTGFVYGIPRGGTTEWNQGGGVLDGDRRSMLEELWQAYLTCVWASACVDVIARTITAGGLEVAWVGDEQHVPDPPAQVQQLEDLFAYVNDHEDIRQLTTGMVADLLVFGDSFTEVGQIGGQPCALWSLDAPSMTVLADEHGTVTGYVQHTQDGRRAEFTPDQVIHISLDSLRSGVTGVSPTQKNLLPITVWLFTAATLKEVMRKGDPSSLHVDFPAEIQDAEVKRWASQYQVRNLGARNIGTPITTRGGAEVHELRPYGIQHYIVTLDQKRDEILSGYGVPPAKVGVIESGNLGGGTGTTQDRTFKVNTCGPIAAIIAEKLQFVLGRMVGLPDGWGIQFREVDWRDDETIDKIASTRLRDGRWTLNRARAEIGEAPVDGGDAPVLVDRQNLVLWSDMADASRALIDSKEHGTQPPAGVAVPTETAECEQCATGDGPAGPRPAVAVWGGVSRRANARRAWQESYLRELARLNADE